MFLFWIFYSCSLNLKQLRIKRRFREIKTVFEVENYVVKIANQILRNFLVSTTICCVIFLNASISEWYRWHLSVDSGDDIMKFFLRKLFVVTCFSFACCHIDGDYHKFDVCVYCCWACKMCIVQNNTVFVVLCFANTRRLTTSMNVESKTA